MRSNFISGLDIGSSYVRVVVAQVNEDGRLYVIGAAEVPTEGITKGGIASIEDAVSSITAGLEQVERMIGAPVERAMVGISGSHIMAQDSRGVIAVSRADGEIREDDVERVIEAAQAVATPPNYEILHVIPRTFTVDNQSAIKDPIGMTGVRLEVAAQIIQGLSSQIKNLTKAVYRTGIEIDDLVLSILANSEATLTKRQKELGVLLINLGAATSSFAVFEEGDVLTTGVVPVGSGHITNDLAIGLRTSIDVAENIKLEYGQADPRVFSKKEEIDLGEIADQAEEKVSLKHVAEIVEARVEEIFDLVDKELVKIERSGLLPAGVVITGGGSRLPGIIDVAKKKFRLPAALGYPHDIQTAIDKVNDLTFTTAIGLVQWAYQLGAQKRRRLKIPFGNNIRDLADRGKKLLKHFLP
jgi:cell division protein FtsA